MKSAVRRLTAKGSEPPVPVARSAYRGSNVFQMGTGTQSKEMQLRAYRMSGTVYAIVSLLASTASAPEWRLYKKQPKDGRRRYTTGDVGSDQRTEVVQHAALSLWKRPNSLMSGFEFREGAQQHFELTGETFWVMDRDAGFPTSMWYVRPDRMEAVIDADGGLAGWMYSAFTGEQIPLTTDQVVLEKTPDPEDPFRGLSPIASIMPNVQQQHYATDYMRNLFLNGAQPDGIISFPDKVEDADYDEFVARWRESHMGVSNAGRVGILEFGATWLPGTQSNRDLEYGNLRLMNRDEIREAYRMHKALLGTVEDVNRANAQTAEEVFTSQLQVPRLERRKQTLDNKLLPMFGAGQEDVYEFDYDDPSPVNQEAANEELSTKANAAAALITAGFDPAAVLEAVGLPEMDVVEEATQAPALPPGWVPAPPAAQPPPDSAEELANRLRRILNDGYRPVETGRR